MNLLNVLHVYLHQPNRPVLPENGIKSWYINFKDITTPFEINSTRTCTAWCKKSPGSGYILTVSPEIQGSSSIWSRLPAYCTEALPSANNQYSSNNIAGFPTASTLTAVWVGLYPSASLRIRRQAPTGTVYNRGILKSPDMGKMVRLFTKCALRRHCYADSTYGHIAPTHDELALTHLVLRAHMHL